MGCWNGTCGLTQTPINSGDEIVLFPLASNVFAPKSLSGAGCCYPHDVYHPLTMPVFGKYNDYGGIEEIEGNTENYTKFFQALDIKSSAEEFDEKVDFNSLESILNDGFERKTIYCETGYGREDFAFMMVPRELYYAVVDNMGARVPYDKQEPYRYFVEKQCNASLSKLKALEKARAAKDIDAVMDLHSSAVGDSGIGGYFNGFGAVGVSFVSTFVNTILHTEEGRKQLVDFALFCQAMEFMRKLWLPQAGQGSQANEWSLPLTLSKYVEKRTKELRQEAMDNDYDDLENCLGETLFVRD